MLILHVALLSLNIGGSSCEVVTAGIHSCYCVAWDCTKLEASMCGSLPSNPL